MESFSLNCLNELSNVTRGGTLTVAGTTTRPATSVTVNDEPATLCLDMSFFCPGFTLANGNNTFTAIAQDAHGRKDTNSATCYLPSSIPFAYDANGNLTNDGPRNFIYDDENQLVTVVVVGAWKSDFAYDGKLRRRLRFESTWNGSAWVTNTTVRYVYDGNLVLQERDANNVLLVTYTHGPDLSGTLQGAGGIGGLLARSDNQRLAIAYASPHTFYHADGNGNITALVDTNQVVVAKYLYDPYGNTLAQTGPLADANLYRFSSKELHANSGLPYYVHRFYDPALHRWPNRDPIGEAGGVNLYGYVGNNPIGRIDPYGLAANEVYGLNGYPVGPSSLYAPGGVGYVPGSLPPMPWPGYLFGGVVVGMAGAAVVAVAAPAAVSGLTLAGMAPASATATVTSTLGFAGAAGGLLTVGHACVSGINRNWNAVAFNIGTLGGGAMLGGGGGGRFIADNVSQTPSTVPKSMNPFTADYVSTPTAPNGYGFQRNSELPLGTDLWNWLGTGPTPSSGGGSATGVSSGASTGTFLLLQGR